MTPSKIHIDTVEMLLASITLTMGEDGAHASFMFGKPGAPQWSLRTGMEIYYHFVELNLAALYVRANGPIYLKSLPLNEIVSKLQRFTVENFGHISRALSTFDEDRPFNIWISAEEKKQLATALAGAPIFNPKNELTLFPLIPIKVDDKIRCEGFFFSSPTANDPFF